MAYIGSSPTKVVSRQSANIFTYTATANQTAFTGADDNSNTLACSPSDLMVHMNGIKLEESDYTASTTTVTLVSGAAAGDEVTITAFLTFESADHYTKSAADTRYVNASGDTMSGDLTIDTNTFHVDVADNRVGIGTTTPAQPLHVFKSGSAGGGLVPLIKVQNDTNNITGDGSGIEFHGKYQGGEWGFGKIGGTNSGSNFGGALEFYTNTGTGSVSTGFTKKMTIDRTGAVTKPNQPAFMCRPPTGYTVSANGGAIGGTWVTSNGGYNTGGHFNLTNGVFTAPVAGKYFFTWTALISQGHSRLDSILYVNGSKYARTEINGYTSSQTNRSTTVTAVFNLSANDNVSFGIAGFSGSPLQTYSGNNTPWSYAAGYLLG